MYNYACRCMMMYIDVQPFITGDCLPPVAHPPMTIRPPHQLLGHSLDGSSDSVCNSTWEHSHGLQEDFRWSKCLCPESQGENRWNPRDDFQNDKENWSDLVWYGLNSSNSHRANTHNYTVLSNLASGPNSKSTLSTALFKSLIPFGLNDLTIAVRAVLCFKGTRNPSSLPSETHQISPPTRDHQTCMTLGPKTWLPMISHSFP